MSPESAGKKIKYRSERTPYVRGPLEAVRSPGVERVVLMWASQTSKTDGVLDNVIAFYIDQDPSNVLMVQPREFDAKKWSKSRLAPMLRDTPVLRDKVREPRSRDSNNTVLEKYFPGGRIVIAGANAPAGLAGDSAMRLVMCDEVDRYPPSAGAEGDPVSLAENRAAAAVDSVVLLTSTPGTKGISRIEKAYEDSDQRVYKVPCGACGAYQVLLWSQVKWEKDERGQHLPETAVYECEHCGARWNDAERWSAVRSGEWVATEPFRGTAGFHLNALYAPWENLRLAKLADRWLKAQEHPELLKVFVNTVLAETWAPKYKGVHERLIDRREEYPVSAEGGRLAPAGVVLMTAGVDLQDDRLEVQIDGWGSGEETWRLEYHVLWGDPSSPSVWLALDELLARARPMERGGVDYVRGISIDTGGHHTQAAYEFCRPRFRRVTPDGRFSYVFAIKGQAGTGDVWPARATRSNIGKVPLWMIRVDPAKELIYSRLGVVQPGPGYVHFPLSDEFGERYFEQLTIEKSEQRTDKHGFAVQVWVKPEGARNEAFDASVYSYAALCGLKAMGLDLEREAARVKALAAAAPQAAPAEPATPKPRTGRRWTPAQL